MALIEVPGDLHQIVDVAFLLVGRVLRPHGAPPSMSKLGGLLQIRTSAHPLPISLKLVDFFAPRTIFGPRSIESCLA